MFPISLRAVLVKLRRFPEHVYEERSTDYPYSKIPSNSPMVAGCYSLRIASFSIPQT